MFDFELSFDHTCGPQSDPQDVCFCGHVVGGDDSTHVLKKTEKERERDYFYQTCTTRNVTFSSVQIRGTIIKCVNLVQK